MCMYTCVYMLIHVHTHILATPHSTGPGQGGWGPGRIPFGPPKPPTWTPKHPKSVSKKNLPRSPTPCQGPAEWSVASLIHRNRSGRDLEGLGLAQRQLGTQKWTRQCLWLFSAFAFK